MPKIEDHVEPSELYSIYGRRDAALSSRVLRILRSLSGSTQHHISTEHLAELALRGEPHAAMLFEATSNRIHTKLISIDKIDNQK